MGAASLTSLAMRNACVWVLQPPEVTSGFILSLARAQCNRSGYGPPEADVIQTLLNTIHTYLHSIAIHVFVSRAFSNTDFTKLPYHIDNMNWTY